MPWLFIWNTNVNKFWWSFCSCLELFWTAVLRSDLELLIFLNQLSCLAWRCLNQLLKASLKVWTCTPRFLLLFFSIFLIYYWIIPAVSLLLRFPSTKAILSEIRIQERANSFFGSVPTYFKNLVPAVSNGHVFYAVFFYTKHSFINFLAYLQFCFSFVHFLCCSRVKPKYFVRCLVLVRIMANMQSESWRTTMPRLGFFHSMHKHQCILLQLVWFTSLCRVVMPR